MCVCVCVWGGGEGGGKGGLKYLFEYYVCLHIYIGFIRWLNHMLVPLNDSIPSSAQTQGTVH